jgi:hypothetical protein
MPLRGFRATMRRKRTTSPIGEPGECLARPLSAFVIPWFEGSGRKKAGLHGKPAVVVR